MNRLGALAAGDKVGAHGACFERSLIAIDKEGPRIVGIRRRSPGTVLPDGVEVVKLEGGGLRVGYVRLAALLDEYPAGGGDALGPAEAEHPPHGVEHVDAHVAHDPVAVFHKGAPPPLMR